MRIYNVKVNGKTFEVKILSVSETEPLEVKQVKAAPAAQAPQQAPAAPKAESSAPVEGTKVVAPMQGTVLSVNVKPGDQVKEGDNLLILEAMKLENEIKAPRAGKVASVSVSKGQSVNSQDLLVVLE